MKHLPFIAAMLLVAGAGSARALEPANPKTNAKARAILDYLEGLPQRADKRLLSGQFTNAGPTAKLAICAEIHEKTGHWPAIVGLDYADFSKGGLEYKTVNRLAIEYAGQGGLVTISAHMYNPANPKGGGLRDTGVDLKKILTPGNEAYDRWMKELDIMAAGLAELQDGPRRRALAAVPRDERRLVLVGRQGSRDLHPRLAADVRLLHQDQGAEQPAVALLAQPRRENGRLLCRGPLRGHRRAGRLHRLRRSPAHPRLRRGGPAAQAVRLHGIRSPRRARPAGRLRLPALHRRCRKALPQGYLLPRLEREMEPRGTTT